MLIRDNFSLPRVSPCNYKYPAQVQIIAFTLLPQLVCNRHIARTFHKYLLNSHFHHLFCQTHDFGYCITQYIKSNYITQVDGDHNYRSTYRKWQAKPHVGVRILNTNDGKWPLILRSPDKVTNIPAGCKNRYVYFHINVCRDELY